jgi:hypothetical protein
MQTTFTTFSCGPMFYTSQVSDIADRTWELARASMDSMGAGFLIVEVDANNRIRVLPYNLSLREFYNEIGVGKEDQQMIRYIDSVTDPSTWLYTEDRWETSQAPYFPSTAKIGDIGFTYGKKHWYATASDAGKLNYDGSMVSENNYMYGYYSEADGKFLQDGITLKFAFDTALDTEGVEFYRVRIEKENGDPMYFFKSNKQGMTEFAEIDSRYFTGRIIKNITIDTPVIVDGLTVGETYKVTVQAINFFHVKSKNVITKTFTYNG